MSGVLATRTQCEAIPDAPVEIADGGNIRAGLEDNFYWPNATMAKSNGVLAEAGARLVELTGRRLATIDEARQLLSLPTV